MLIAASLCVALISTGVFIACKKNSPSSGINPEESITQTEETKALQRFVGEQIYYSKNHGDTVYKMVLTGNSGGNININRSVYSTTRPDTIKTLFIVESGISYTGLNSSLEGDTVIVSLDASLNYYTIPFEPGTSTDLEDGGGAIEVYCQATCNDAEPPPCGLKGFFNGTGGINLYCAGFCKCQIVTCTLGNNNPAEKIGKHGGAVLVEAASISVTN